MIILSFNNLKNLNVSLQVGDGVYARGVIYQRSDASGNSIGLPQDGLSLDTGKNHFVGILKNIDDNGNNQYDLHVDNSVTGAGYTPQVDDFIMFSKFTQGDSGVLGYYAEAKFVNDSEDKAELFAVSSDIIINSN